MANTNALNFLKNSRSLSDNKLCCRLQNLEAQQNLLVNKVEKCLENKMNIKTDSIDLSQGSNTIDMSEYNVLTNVTGTAMIGNMLTISNPVPGKMLIIKSVSDNISLIIGNQSTIQVSDGKTVTFIITSCDGHNIKIAEYPSSSGVVDDD